MLKVFDFLFCVYLVLFLVYMNGNGNFCRSLVRVGVRLGIMNK